MNVPNALLKRAVAAVTLAGLVLSPALFSYFTPNLVQNSPPPLTAKVSALHKQEEATQEKVASNDLPLRLKIPKINVDATLEQVGLTPQGAVGVPKGYLNAAWFNQGPRPGEKGSSVLVGHFGLVNGTPAVFDNLQKLHTGDKLYVQDGQGPAITFVVRELRTYGQNEDVPEVFSSNDGKVHLNLITCQGEWNKTQKSYSNRLVAFADEVVE